MPVRIDFWGIPTTWGSPAIYVYFLMALGSLILLCDSISVPGYGGRWADPKSAGITFTSGRGV